MITHIKNNRSKKCDSVLFFHGNVNKAIHESGHPKQLSPGRFMDDLYTYSHYAYSHYTYRVQTNRCEIWEARKSTIPDNRENTKRTKPEKSHQESKRKDKISGKINIINNDIIGMKGMINRRMCASSFKSAKHETMSNGERELIGLAEIVQHMGAA